MKKYLFLFSFLMLFSCNAIRGIDMSDIDLGMSKAEVQMKKKAFHTKTIGAKQYAEGKMEVFQISEVYRHENQINGSISSTIN